MAATNSTSTMVGTFKEQYAKEIVDLTKPILKITDRIEFNEATAVGNKYHQPVDLTMEHGVTYAAANASSPVTLLSPVAGQMQDAQVEGAQVFARSQVDYETIFRAQQAGPKAFVNATKHIVKRLSKSAAKRLEISVLHGQRGVGEVESISGTSTTRTLVLTAESSSPGIWAGMKNATLDFWTTSFSAVISGTGPATVTSVSYAPSTGKVTLGVSGDATYLTNLDTEVGSPTGGATAGGGKAQIFFETASPTKEMAGLDKIIRNTGSLFNIDASSYELWGGNTYSTATGAIQMGKMLEALATPVSYGAEGEYVAVLAPRAFEVLNTDLAALRMLDKSYDSKRGENGFGSLKYHFQNGSLEILAHPLQKNGLVHVFNPKECKRIGATELTFINRRGSEEVLILELANTAGSEMRCYANQALFMEAPKRSTVMAGVTYS